jgi:outer membrane protein assembly factor BamB
MRRLRIVLISLFAVSLSGCLWPSVGMDPARSGFNPYEDVLTVGNVSTLSQAWAVPTSTGYGVGAPVTYGTGVYISTGRNAWAFEAATGARRWVTPEGYVFLSSDLAVAADGIYGQGPNFINPLGPSHNSIVKLSPADGSVIWDVDTGSAGEVLVAPVVSGNTVYFGGWNAFTTNGGAVASGTSLLGNGTTAIGGGHVYSGVDVFDGAFAAGCSGTPKVCSPLWSYAPSSSSTTGPVYTSGAVFMGTFDGTVEAFDPNGCATSPCAPLWTDVAAGSITGSPAVANGVVYVGSSNGTLYAFDAAGCGSSTCSPLWTVSTGGAIKAQPSVAKGVVFFGSDDGKVYAVNGAGCGSSTCAPLWSSAAGAPVETQAAVAHGSVYVSRTDGSLTAYRVSG